MSPNTPEEDWTNARLNYLDAHATHNASDSGTTKEGAWYYRYLQTFDLEFPELLGDYAYTATSRFTTAAEGATISDFGNNKVLGYWEHSYAQVNAEVASGGGGTAKVVLTNSTTDNISYTSDDNEVNPTVLPYSTTSNSVKLDGHNYPVVPTGTEDAVYEHKVTLKATANIDYDFVGWYSDSSCTNLVSNDASYIVASPDNPDSGVAEATYYAKYKHRTVIYIAPRKDWGDNVYLRAYSSTDSNTNYTSEYGDTWNKAVYDTATGFYKTTFSTSATGKFRCIIASDTNYSSQVPASGTQGYEGNIGSSYVFYDGTPGQLYSFNNHRCFWFIDGTTNNWLKTDWDGSKWMRVYVNSADTWMYRRDNYTMCVVIENPSGDLYFKETENGQDISGNQWSTTVQANKNQYTASGATTGSWN